MKYILLLVSLAVTINGYSQKLNNKLSFQKGQKLEVVHETNRTSTMQFMGQSMDTKAETLTTTTLDVENVTDTGTSIEQKVKRLKFNITSAMQSQSFDSEKEGDRNGQIGKLIEKSLKNKFTMTVDASGKVTSVKVDDDNPNGNKEAEDMANLVTSQLGMNISVPRIGDPSIFKILPNREIAIGDTWTDSLLNNGQNTKWNYTLKSITGNDVVLDYTEVSNTDTKQNMMGMEATIKTNFKGTGTVTIDKTTGLLKQRKGTLEEEGNIEVQGQSIPIKGKSDFTITVQPAQ